MHIHITNQSNKLVEFATAACTWKAWHWILGHISIGAVKTLKNNNLVNGMEVDRNKEQCTACIQGCQTVKTFPEQAEDDITQIGKLTVSDIWGLANTRGPNWEQYFYSFTDTKTEVLKYFKEYKSVTSRNTHVTLLTNLGQFQTCHIPCHTPWH